MPINRTENRDQSVDKRTGTEQKIREILDVEEELRMVREEIIAAFGEKDDPGKNPDSTDRGKPKTSSLMNNL